MTSALSAKFELKLSEFQTRHPKVIVASHERSGTHFLMNSLAAVQQAQGKSYLATPWINFDFDLGINFHAPSAIAGFFAKLKGRSVRNLVKTHHSADFFRPVMKNLSKEYRILMIYRSPCEVMMSYQRYMHRWKWREGPKVDTPGEFMRSPPEGAMLRYQMHQCPTTLSRWQQHVEGWHDLAIEFPKVILPIQFDDLDQSFDETILATCRWLGIHEIEQPIRRPDATQNVVAPTGRGVKRDQSNSPRATLTDEDLRWMRRKVGGTMKKVGLPWKHSTSRVVKPKVRIVKRTGTKKRT